MASANGYNLYFEILFGIVKIYIYKKRQIQQRKNRNKTGTAYVERKRERCEEKKNGDSKSGFKQNEKNDIEKQKTTELCSRVLQSVFFLFLSSMRI